MAFTSHGHHIPFTCLGDKRPEHVAGCGGPRFCPTCTRESQQFEPGAVALQKYYRGHTLEPQKKAKQAVIDYVNRNADVTDDFTLNRDDVYVVWFCKTLQNWKALVSTTVPDGMYYELTYNGDKGELYLDAYKKFKNVTIPD